MAQLVERLLPWLLAAVAGLVLAVGLHGFRAERPAPAPEPVSTTPLVTEVSDDIAEVVLPDGAVLVLRPGTVGYDLARFLNGSGEPPASFPVRELALEELSPLAPAAVHEPAETERTVLAVAAILKAYPTARLRIEAEPETARRLMAWMEAAGVPADRMESADAENPAASSPVTLTLVSR